MPIVILEMLLRLVLEVLAAVEMILHLVRVLVEDDMILVVLEVLSGCGLIRRVASVDLLIIKFTSFLIVASIILLLILLERLLNLISTHGRLVEVILILIVLVVVPAPCVEWVVASSTASHVIASVWWLAASAVVLLFVSLSTISMSFVVTLIVMWAVIASSS